MNATPDHPALPTPDRPKRDSLTTDDPADPAGAPRFHEGGVFRARLINTIDSPDVARVTLITAPAGFGKSTLAAQWARQTDRLVVWVSLHSGSNTPDRFLDDLQLALEIETKFQLADNGVGGPTLSVILARLRAASATRPVTIVLDDYHLIVNRDVHRVIDALIRELPSNTSIMILSRTLPPLALGRLRVERQVREITEGELRFDHRDLATLVAMESDRDLTSTQIALLMKRTDGWIAGIRLALLALLPAADEQIDTMIEAFSAHQWLDDYIVEEVLSGLPGELRDFVLRTVSFRVLEPELCDMALGINNSASLIDELARRLVFVRRDTRSGTGVVYHALFAECVEHIAKRVIPISEISAQHAQAAIWLERHGRLEVALDHAIVSEEWPAALRILRGICDPLWLRDLHHSLLHWMEKLPIEQLRRDHELLYWYIHKLFCVGRLRDAIIQFEVAEPLWKSSGNPAETGFAMSCRAFKAAFEGQPDTTLCYSYRALHYLPEQHHASRMRAWSSVAEREFQRGNDELSTHAYYLAEHCRQFLPAEQRWWMLEIELTRINQYAVRGNLPAADRLYTVAVDRIPPQFRDAAGRAYFRMAAISLEWNLLDQAQEHVDRFVQDPERFLWQNWYTEAWLIAARVALARGDYERAQLVLDELFAMLEKRGETHTTARARAVSAQLWLQQGEVLLAGAWADSVRVDKRAWPASFGETDPLAVMIQVRIVQERYDEALSLATTRTAEGLEPKRIAELVSLYVLQAAAQYKLGRTDDAIESLRAAFAFGMPGRFRRSFFPAGIELIPFYLDAIDRLGMEETVYLTGLIESQHGREFVDETATLEPGPVEPPAAPGGLLSPREREILELIRDGLSSREIAERLFIGESTIKKHLTRSFQKLNVINRTAAVIRAQELGLFS